ncbi:MFS transporter, partial [filamentous cyanobacterium CCP5]
VIYWAIRETLAKQHGETASFWQGWGQALGDRSLIIYVAVNIMFTGYLSQVQSTLPVYFNRFVGSSNGGGLSEGTLSILFAGHVALAAILQLPVARYLNRYSQPRGLMLSAISWGIGFLLVGLAGYSGMFPTLWAAAALAVMALGMIAYTPIASSLVVLLAPANQRGVYLSVNSMCWAIGYLIGPPVGGWALDQGRTVANGFWLLLALSILLTIAILQWLDQRLLKTGEQPANP